MSLRVRWVGNSHKKEFHRIEENKQSGTRKAQPQGCQLDEVPNRHRIEFRTAKDARVLLYDPCAYCTKKFTSRK